MIIKFKKLHPNAIEPTKAHKEDAGWDLSVPKGYIPNVILAEPTIDVCMLDSLEGTGLRGEGFQAANCISKFNEAINSTETSFTLRNSLFRAFPKLIEELNSRKIPIAYIKYKLSISIQIPEGYYGMIVPRSSITNYPIMLKNSIGIIDSGYTGEIEVRFKVLKGDYSELLNYTKIAQLLIHKVEDVKFEELLEYEALNETLRGVGGFGSSDKIKQERGVAGGKN